MADGFSYARQPGLPNLSGDERRKPFPGRESAGGAPRRVHPVEYRDWGGAIKLAPPAPQRYLARSAAI